jgi:hypothetical protein
MSQGLCPSCGAAVNLAAANNAAVTSPIARVQAAVVENHIEYNESDVINAIKVQFTDENAKVFLKRFWQKKRKDNGINETGFCYWASHAYFHFMGGKSVGLYVKKWPNPMVENEGHFWVEKASGERVDLTKEQYRNVGGFNHYNDGKPARQPNKKGRILKFISLVEAELEKLFLIN